MQALTGIADQSGKAFLDIEVNIFKIKLPDEFAAQHLVFDLRHAALNIFQVLHADNFACGQHLRMRKRALNIE